MKNRVIQTLFPSFVIAIVLLLNISPALAGDLHETGEHKGKFHGRVEVIFTKWLADFPNMAGVVSGDVGGGTFSGEVLNLEHTPATDKIEALYHINGGAHHFTAHNFVTQNNLKGTAVIHGVVTDGPLKGARVRGEYQVINPCGVINAQNGSGGDFCFQGTLTIRAGSED
jgi:hypothetical protein